MQPHLETAIRLKQETRLKELLQEQEEKKKAAIERKYALKYHKIRFFERVKIERQLKKLQRKHRACHNGEDGVELLSEAERKEMRRLEEDLQYVIHFPKGEKYVSLLKDADTPEAQTRLEEERTRLKKLVKLQLAEMALVAEADEGRSLVQELESSDKIVAEMNGKNNNDMIEEHNTDASTEIVAGKDSKSRSSSVVDVDDFFLLDEPGASKVVAPETQSKIAATEENNEINEAQNSFEHNKGDLVSSWSPKHQDTLSIENAEETSNYTSTDVESEYTDDSSLVETKNSKRMGNVGDTSTAVDSKEEVPPVLNKAAIIPKSAKLELPRNFRSLGNEMKQPYRSADKSYIELENNKPNGMDDSRNKSASNQSKRRNNSIGLGVKNADRRRHGSTPKNVNNSNKQSQQPLRTRAEGGRKRRKKK